MRKLLVGIFSLFTLTAFTQDLQSVQRSIASSDYLAAKKQIDSFFTDKKNNVDAPAWYYKGRVYTEVVREHHKGNYNFLQDAFKAYVRYQELDPQNKLMQLNNNLDLFQLYDLSYNTAADFYNDKNYDLAYYHFKIALSVEDYIRKKGFSFQGITFPTFDTSLINLAGSAAYLSNKEEEAIPYFERLAVKILKAYMLCYTITTHAKMTTLKRPGTWLQARKSIPTMNTGSKWNWETFRVTKNDLPATSNSFKNNPAILMC